MSTQRNEQTATLPRDYYALVYELIVADAGYLPKSFDNPLHVLDVFNEVVYVYGVWCSPDNRIFINCSNGRDLWDHLETTDRNYRLVITALYNRLSVEREVKAA